jgi:hypothetical protein
MNSKYATLEKQKINYGPEKVARLHKALEDQTNFWEFANNPKAFAARYGLVIDDDLSQQLAGKLKGISSLEMLGEHMDISVGLITRALAKATGAC